MAPKQRTKAKLPSKRFPLNMRTTKEVRDHLEASAGKSGRSLAQEVEFRLENSFRDQRLAEQALELAFGPRLGALLLALGRAMHSAGTVAATLATHDPAAQANWYDDPRAFEQAIQAANSILEWQRPTGDREMPEPLKGSFGGKFDHVGSQIGRGSARAVIEAIEGRGVTRDLQEFGARLGPALARGEAK